MELTQEQIKAILDRVELRLSLMRKKKYEFYDESGISSASFSQWKTGKHPPSQAALRKMADYLGVSLEWLIDGKEDGKPEEPESNYPVREQMRDEMRILFDAAEDAPVSAILEAAALIMRYKEKNE